MGHAAGRDSRKHSMDTTTKNDTSADKGRVGLGGLLSVFTPAIRRKIRDRLSLNWAGRYDYSFQDGGLIERARYPASVTWDNKGNVRVSPAPPAAYRVLAGKSDNPVGDHKKGRMVSFWGHIRGTIVPPRRLGIYTA